MYEDFMRQQAEAVEYMYSWADHPTCPQCGGTMNFHGGRRRFGNGFWDCEGCNFSFTENDLEPYKEDL